MKTYYWIFVFSIVFASITLGCSDESARGENNGLDILNLDSSDVQPEPTCDDGIKNGTETDVDCGGSCSPCASGSQCENNDDCSSDTCIENICKDPSCDDGVQDGNETGVDCGGSCGPCEDGAACNQNDDCSSGVCTDGTCQAPTCDDGVQNGEELGIDCGANACSTGCPDGNFCNDDKDCLSLKCDNELNTCLEPTCDDGILNGDELGIDCGGSCEPCPPLPETCSNGEMDGDETEIDCGGSCEPCASEAECLDPSDCASGVCLEGICQAPSCEDGVLNGDEVGVDCGGSCNGCPEGSYCGQDS